MGAIEPDYMKTFWEVPQLKREGGSHPIQKHKPLSNINSYLRRKNI